jgi:hypothetical protein
VTGENLDLQRPGAARDDRFKQWWARFERLVASPQQIRELATILRYHPREDVADG